MLGCEGGDGDIGAEWFKFQYGFKGQFLSKRYHLCTINVCIALLFKGLRCGGVVCIYSSGVAKQPKHDSFSLAALA